MLVVWLAPCVVDRIRWSEPNVCKWEPSKNREFVIFVAIVGHHLPDVIMIFCFIRVFAAMRKRRLALRSAQATCTPSQSVTTSAQPDPASRQGNQNSQVCKKPPCLLHNPCYVLICHRGDALVYTNHSFQIDPLSARNNNKTGNRVLETIRTIMICNVV